MRITLLTCLAGGLLLNAAARADDAVLPGNPYAPVVTRNIFGLNPPPPPVDPNAADATPPPKITPNGITDILGQLQVLFKVANPAKAGKPAADEDYILSEGERQDDIEVVKIDEKAGVVTFNNHGETQELPLVAGTASSPAAAAAGAVPGNPAAGFKPAPGALLRPGANAFNGGGGSSLIGNFGGGNRGNGNNGMNGGGSGGGNGGNNFGGLGNGSNSGSAITQPGYHLDGPPVDPAVQTVVIEALRQQYQSAGDSAANILPVTALTPGADSGN
jgi:hypothetical protein